MDQFSQLLAGAIFVLLIILILYVMFGQVTVRKLRNNPETKDALGFQYASGTETSNIIKILGMSRSKAEKLKKGEMSFLYADVDLIYRNTNKFDRTFAKLLLWLMIIWALSMATLVALYLIGFLE